jgi:VCBS repeat-containing protein
MSFPCKWRVTLLTALLVLVAVGGWRSAAADDVFHAVTGVVKSVDKATKTMVVKTADGTEHTIKYTDNTTVKGAKDAGKGMEKASVDTYLAGKEGTKVTVKYTEKGGEKTAVGIKDAGKATGKAMTQ